jgi:ankyrin repeat protein
MHYSLPRLVVILLLSVSVMRGQSDDSKISYDSALARSVAEGEGAAIVGHLLQLGANPNSKNSDGLLILVDAMHMGAQVLMGKRGDPNLEIVTLLLDHGADPNALNTTWQTPLMAAALVGDERLIKLLLDHKANVNVGSKFGMTALMYARRVPIIKLLLAAGANVNDKEIKGKTALHWAASRGDPDAVKLLIDAGANVNAQDDRGVTPLALARQRLCCSGPFAEEHTREAQQKRSQVVIEVLVAAGAA